MPENRNRQCKVPDPSVKPKRIVVVDDDPVIRNMVADLLESEGHSATLARNGHEALQLLQEPESALVFLDLMMPGFSGRDVCAALGEQPQVRQRHILVLMSAMDHIDETSGLDIDMLMPKPFVIEDLEQALETYMSGAD